MKFTFVPFLALLLLFSCNKAVDPIDKPPIDSGPKQKSLSKITVTQLNSKKVLCMQEWKYDNNRRCTELLQKRAFPTRDNAEDTFRIAAYYRFYYNGAEKEP